MSAMELHITPSETGFQSQSAELRRDYLHVLSYGAFAILILATMRTAAWRDTPNLFHTWQVTLVLAVGLIITNALRVARPRLASWIFIGTLLITNVIEVILFPQGPALYFFVAIGVAASLLRSEHGAGITFALILGVMIGLAILLRDHLTFAQVFWPCCLVALVSVIAWLGTHQLYTVLQWEWHSTQQALTVAREAQNHRAELLRLNKELDGAYIRMARMNRMLILARQEAEEAKALKVQFANAVSHELRSPLNLIIGFSDMMVYSPEVYEQQTWSPRLKSHITQIYQSSQHLSQLIDDVLDMARIDAYRLSLSKQRTAVRDIIAETHEIVKSLFEARGLFLRMEIEPGLPDIMLDRTRIRQVLLNLLTNAVRFTEQGGVIVRVYRGKRANPVDGPTPSGLIISVQDTGIGIAQADLPKLFQVFCQLEGSYRWNRGTGLGLSISKQLVELHGGTIWAESTPNLGTTFSFQLPIGDDFLDGETSSASPSSLATEYSNEDVFWHQLEQKARRQRNVIVISDEQHARRMISTHLNTYDIAWLPTNTSDVDILRTAASVHPSACIYIGNTVDGFRPSQPLIEELAGLPFVTCALPGITQPPPIPALFDYLIKPVSRHKLAETIQRVEQALGERGIQTVVLVDDEAAIREFLELSLKSILGDHIRVIATERGHAALQAITQTRPDLVLVDLNLPDMDGLDVAQQIYEQYRGQMLVVAVSARDLRHEGYEVIPDFISCTRTKRFTQQEVAGMLNGLLDSLSPSAALSSRLSAAEAAEVEVGLQEHG